MKPYFLLHLMCYIAHQWFIWTTRNLSLRIYFYIAPRRSQKIRIIVFTFVTGVKQTSWCLLRPWFKHSGDKACDMLTCLVTSVTEMWREQATGRLLLPSQGSEQGDQAPGDHDSVRSEKAGVGWIKSQEAERASPSFLLFICFLCFLQSLPWGLSAGWGVQGTIEMAWGQVRGPAWYRGQWHIQSDTKLFISVSYGKSWMMVRTLISGGRTRSWMIPFVVKNILNYIIAYTIKQLYFWTYY